MHTAYWAAAGDKTPKSARSKHRSLPTQKIETARKWPLDPKRIRYCQNGRNLYPFSIRGNQPNYSLGQTISAYASIWTLKPEGIFSLLVHHRLKSFRIIK